MDIQIEDNIPLPARPIGGLRGRKPVRPTERFPFDQMEVGQSFFLEAEPKEDEELGKTIERIRARVMRMAAQYRDEEDPDFHGASRIYDDGVRFWRVSEPARGGRRRKKAKRRPAAESDGLDEEDPGA